MENSESKLAFRRNRARIVIEAVIMICFILLSLVPFKIIAGKPTENFIRFFVALVVLYLLRYRLWCCYSCQKSLSFSIISFNFFSQAPHYCRNCAASITDKDKRKNWNWFYLLPILPIISIAVAYELELLRVLYGITFYCVILGLYVYATKFNACSHCNHPLELGNYCSHCSKKPR